MVGRRIARPRTFNLKGKSFRPGMLVTTLHCLLCVHAIQTSLQNLGQRPHQGILQHLHVIARDLLK